MSTTATATTECRWCGQYHGPQCPQVKAIEFHPDGSVKRVEFKSAADYASVQISAGPFSPESWGVTRPTPSTYYRPPVRT